MVAMKHTRDHGVSGLRPLRLQQEILDAARGYIVPSFADPVLEALEVSHADMSMDLCNVTIFLMPAAGETPPPTPQIRAALERAQPFARRLLAESVLMKRTPMVRLAYLPVRPAPPTPTTAVASPDATVPPTERA